MRRIAFVSLASVILLASVTGCSVFKKKDATAEAVYDPTLAPADSGYAAYPADGGGTMGTGGGRYHTVQKKETLYSISRQYYGDHTKWKEIYAANRSDIGDPNKIRVGQKLMIP